MSGWANSDDFRMSTGSPASSPWLECGVSSVTLGPWSSRSAGAEKNSLRGVRDRVSRLLRPTAAPRARPLLWRQAGLSRALGSPGRLPSVWWREARAARLVGGQPALHQAVRLLRGPALPREHRPGDRRGTAPGLADRQGAGQAVHAGTTPPGRLPRAAGHRHRRDRRRQGPQLPHRRQRPGAGAADLVRRHDRSEASLDEFFAWLGPEKCRKIRLAVMDMWKAFRKSTLKEGHAPQARIIYDKFHVLKHLGEAMDEVRKREYARLSGKDAASSRGRSTTCSLAGRT